MGIEHSAKRRICFLRVWNDDIPLPIDLFPSVHGLQIKGLIKLQRLNALLDFNYGGESDPSASFMLSIRASVSPSSCSLKN